ncbi:MAG: hypothetical protein IPI05_06325 [Flavobacteriales bacterium]|nr:hypothetical protein [Flavobacteriales bacterium]
MRKGCALVRSEFGIDPSGLSDEEFIDRWTEASWLLHHKAELLGKRLGLIK